MEAGRVDGGSVTWPDPVLPPPAHGTSLCPVCGHAVAATDTTCLHCRTDFIARNSRRDQIAPRPPVVPPPAGTALPPPTPPSWRAFANPYQVPIWPPVAPAPTPPRRRGRMALAVGAAVAVFATSVAGAVSIHERRGPNYPKQWDPRVATIAGYVARVRGLTFRHPVRTDFLTAEQYRAAALGGDDIDAGGSDGGGAMTDDDYVAQFRAVGLISGRVDLKAAGDTLADSGTLAFYSPADKRVRVRGTDLTPALRVTLAHELTHALQDQYFDLSLDRLSSVPTLRPIVEGDAVRVERAYEAGELTDAEREQKAKTDEADRSAFEQQAANANVPTVLSTAFELPYAVGPQFVAITATRGGNRAVDELLRHPPASDVGLLDPLRPAAPTETVGDPALPDGAEVLDRTPMGAGFLFLLLGEHSEPATAFDAAVAWSGESSVISRQNGRICFDADFHSDSAAAASLLDTFAAWRAAMPAEAGANVRGRGDDVVVHGCDPGADVKFAVPGRTEQTLTYAAIHAEIELELLRDAEMAADRALCVADAATRTISAADLAVDGFGSAPDPEVVAAVQKAAATC